MMLVLGWEHAAYDERGRQHVADAIAGLHAERLLTGCLAALPADPGQRDWLLSAVSALRRMASIRASAMLSGAAVSTDSLAACQAAAIDEAVVVHRDADPSSSIRVVREHQRTFGSAAVPTRVWLDGGARDGLQRQITAWKHAGVSLSGVELSPFSTTALDASAAVNGDTAPLACEWFASTLTLSTAGALLPCPAHPTERPAGGFVSAAELVGQRHMWREKLGAHPVCRSCHRLARFVTLDAIQHTASAVYHASNGNGYGHYVDHIRRDSGALSAPERDAALGEFAARLRGCR
jgi:hypothetical protein